MTNGDPPVDEFVARPQAQFVAGARLTALERLRQAGQPSGRTLLMTGSDAVAAAARNIDPSSRLTVASSLGPIELQSGTIYARKQLLVTVDPGTVIYLEQEQLYKEATSVFVRNHYLSVLPEVAERGDWIIKFAKFEWAVISGLLVPMWALLAVSTVNVLLIYKRYPAPFEMALRYGPCVRDELLWLRERHPDIYDILVTAALRELRKELFAAIEAENVAFFVARIVFIIRNVKRNILRGFFLLVNSVLLAAKTALRAAELVGKRQAATAASLAQRDESARRLVEEMKKQGIQLSEEDARKVVWSLMSDPELTQRLEGLRSCLDGLVPSVEEIARRLGII